MTANLQSFFSLDSTLGTARAIVYWDRLTTDQKVTILLSSSRDPDSELQDLILADGDPLCIELAFRYFRRPGSLYLNRNLKHVEKLCGHLNEAWQARLGFSPWDIDELPKTFRPDIFYWWFRGRPFESSYVEPESWTDADIESWADAFFARKLFEQRVLIESGCAGMFRSAVALLTVGVRQKKLSCANAAWLFRSVVQASYDEDCNIFDSTWGEYITPDDAHALAAFITAIALEDDGDTSEKTRSPLRAVLYNLPQIVIDHDSAEPFLSIPKHALSIMLEQGHLGERKHDYTVLRERVAAPTLQTANPL
jgi:hypothetical protein